MSSFLSHFQREKRDANTRRRRESSANRKLRDPSEGSASEAEPEPKQPAVNHASGCLRQHQGSDINRRADEPIDREDEICQVLRRAAKPVHTHTHRQAGCERQGDDDTLAACFPGELYVNIVAEPPAFAHFLTAADEQKDENSSATKLTSLEGVSGEMSELARLVRRRRGHMIKQFYLINVVT